MCRLVGATRGMGGVEKLQGGPTNWPSHILRPELKVEDGGSSAKNCRRGSDKAIEKQMRKILRRGFAGAAPFFRT